MTRCIRKWVHSTTPSAGVNQADSLTMKVFLLTLLFLAVTTGSIIAGDFITLVDEIRLPVPPGWILGSDSSQYPFQLVARDLGAEVILHRSKIWEQEAIVDEVSLRRSVETIVSEVIPNLPSSQLLSSHGYYDKYRASFVLEFRSIDTLQQLRLRHRMMGILYRHPEGHQILFTLAGKSLSEKYAQNEAAIKLIQSGFAYLGVFEKDVFDRKEFPWYSVLALMLVIGLLFFFRSFRSKHDQVRFAEDKNFWRCPGCERLNPRHHAHCRRCGYQCPELDPPT